MGPLELGWVIGVPTRRRGTPILTRRRLDATSGRNAGRSSGLHAPAAARRTNGLQSLATLLLAACNLLHARSAHRARRAGCLLPARTSGARGSSARRVLTARW